MENFDRQLREIEKGEIKIKHIICLILFLPIYILLAIVILFGMLFEEISYRLYPFLNKTIYKAKRDEK
jgi:hypothetical protein